MVTKTEDNQIIEIVKLPILEWRDYKDLRLTALKHDQQAFAKPYKVEADWPDEKWQNRLTATESGNSWLFFARDVASNKLVGMIGGYRDENDLINHSAQIWGVFVRPEFRGKGIAKVLMTQILNELSKNADISKVILEVNVDQQSAKKLYESFGFEVVKTSPMLLGDGLEHPVSVLEKPIR